MTKRQRATPNRLLALLIAVAGAFVTDVSRAAPHPDLVGPALINQGLYDGLLQDRPELASRADIDSARQTVIDFLIHLDRGSAGPFDERLQTLFQVNSWSELRRKYVDDEATLFSAQIYDVDVTASHGRVLLSVIVTGVAEGIPFARFARCWVEPIDGVWKIQTFQVDTESPGTSTKKPNR